MEFKTIPLTFADVRIGMYIQDSDGDYGCVKKCDDIHNILVELKSRTGGYAFYCLDNECKTYEHLYEVKTDNWAFVPDLVEEKRWYESNRKNIVCKCGEVIWMSSETMICPKCNNVLQC